MADSARRAQLEAHRRELFGPCDVRCSNCHGIDPVMGRFGTTGESAFTEQTQVFKIPHLRDLHQKVGMFALAGTEMFGPGSDHMGPQVRGFGFRIVDFSKYRSAIWMEPIDAG